MVETIPEEGPVQVECWSAKELLGAEKKLTIPEFQRSFVWTEDRIRTLIDDLRTYLKSAEEGSSNTPYFMGSILLHRRKDKKNAFEVIDGQQRITALSLLHRQLEDKLPEATREMTYASARSVQHIREACQIIEEEFQGSDKKWDGVFNQICFTVLIVNDQDLAFTLFDTQNSRGVPLSATDLLKAHHLRAIQNKNIQTRYARTWETMDRPNASAKDLFYTYLWRGRRWRGRNVEQFENRDRVLHEFQHKTRKTLPDISLQAHLRRPIAKGEDFFNYAQRLQTIRTTVEASIKEWLDLHESAYAREFLLLSCMMYYDRFEHHRLNDYAKRLEYAIGAVRIEVSRLYRETLRNRFLRDSKENLFDVITMAFLPDEVVTYIEDIAKDLESAYKKATPQQIKESGVRLRYLERVKKKPDAMKIEGFEERKKLIQKLPNGDNTDD